MMKSIVFQKSSGKLGILFLLLCMSVFNPDSPTSVRADTSLLNCVAFSPYINGYDPNFPNDPKKVPPASVIDHLLDIAVQRKYNCILVYGVHPPLDHIFPAAQARSIKVIANIWLEAGSTYAAQNATSIAYGITAAKSYPGTIVKLSCGVEVRNRAVNKTLPVSSAETVINDCIIQLRNAGVTQPITTIDTWWNWCNAKWPCQSWSMANNVDWIGINVYPWWENKDSDHFPCTPASTAPQFQMDRITDVKSVYPSKEIVLTEFGWPAGPDGYSEKNLHTGQMCGIASKANQDYVRIEAIKKLTTAGIQGVVFEAFQEPWKSTEGPVGPNWGIVAPTFSDVAIAHPYYNDIEILYANGLTGGCSTTPLKFCPDQVMNRGESAVFMLRANFGSSFLPTSPTHIFKDNWTKGPWAEPWAEAMYFNGLSAGCLSSPRKYCPWDQIPREQAVIFALRMKYGTNYIPPAATGTLFADLTDVNYYATSWAEQAYKDGLIPNCGMSGGKPKICPKDLVSRGLGAYMIVRAKNLTMP
jgi:exo-beta-1,3-glucanase (GH17 family)